jgi:hypothetical protein
MVPAINATTVNPSQINRRTENDIMVFTVTTYPPQYTDPLCSDAAAHRRMGSGWRGR